MISPRTPVEWVTFSHEIPRIDIFDVILLDIFPVSDPISLKLLCFACSGAIWPFGPKPCINPSMEVST